MFKGTCTAMITPFKKGEVDYKGLVQNIHEQLEAQVEALLFLGTTGEAPTLSHEEQTKIVELAVSEIGDRACILVGTGTNCTRTTLDKTHWAKQLGADIALVIAPYYNKPSQEGLFRHFEALAKNTSLPLLLYNHLGRTGVHIELDTLSRLLIFKTLIGIKETLTNEPYLKTLHQHVLEKRADFSILSGCDDWALDMIKLGTQGVISVISNLAPKPMKQLVDLGLQGNFKEAQALHDQLHPLMTLSCIETNPAPIKAAMKLHGKPSGSCRLPLCDLTQAHHNQLKQFFASWESPQLCPN